MDPQYRHFDVHPKVVRANTECMVTIRPLYPHAAFPVDYKWEVMAVSRERVIDRTSYQSVGTRPAVTLQDGTLSFTYRFEGEQEHRFRIQGGKGEHTIVRGDFNVYSLDADLYARRPYKGDLHLHTIYSDGKCSPAYMAARCRELGLDFLAITDHHTYQGSVEAIAAYKDAPVDVRLYGGEEVHPPGNWVHMVNFGGSQSVNALIGQDKDAYLSAVAEIEKTLPDMHGLARHQYASCVWCYRQIQAGGGLAVLCHPHWNYWFAYSVSEPELVRHFADWPCDALELIGGYSLKEVDCNVLQVARWRDACVKHGRDFPVVGASDAHSADETDHILGWYYTIVFSPTLELADQVASIKAGYSVAVEAIPGQTPRVHGTYRMTKYAYFALNEMFGQHDEYCREEGRLMRAYAAGDANAAPALAALQGRCAKWMEACRQ
ncbi:MAG: PHP domain-containing protein [Phycisphaerae bacterium]